MCRWRHKIRKIAVEILQSVNNWTQCLRESAYYAWLLLTYIVINSILGRLTLDPAGMHCPSWDDAFVSSLVTGLLWRTLYSVVNHSAVIAAQFTRRGCAKAARNTVELLPKNVISSSDFLLIVSV